MFLTVSRRKANILTVNRKSHHPIETLRTRGAHEEGKGGSAIHHASYISLASHNLPTQTSVNGYGSYCRGEPHCEHV